MTTENTPADTSAATGEAAYLPQQRDQQPPAEAAGTPRPKPDEQGAAPPAGEAATPDVGAAANVAAAPQAPASEGSSAPPETPAAGNAADAAAPPKPAPQRRVRLNPTVAPEVARPIPSLRSSEPPPSVSPPVAAESATPAPVESPSALTSPRGADDAADQQPTLDDPVSESASAPAPPAEPVAIPAKNESLDADLEAELEAALSGSDQTAADVVEVTDAQSQAAAAATSPDAAVKRGARLTGIVQSIHGDDMFLEFGLRMAGVLSRRQFGLRKQPMQGEPLEVVVHRIDENESLIHVNLPTGTSKVRGEWDALMVDQNVECMVTGTNKGGLEVNIGALRGFMPASQVELGFVPDLGVYVGQKLKARIAEVNPKRRKLVLSRRTLLEEEREQSQKELFEKIQPGQQYTGRVRSLKDYGAFVDIGGADGLLHVAQISWTRIHHPSEVLKEGEEVEVQVLSVDRDKKKISLGMRQLTQNPWKAAESKYSQGAHIKGKVTRIENFGAFVELEEGVEGLVHISELDHKRVNRVSEVLHVGQEIEVQVIEVDPKRKRVSLSLKALKEKPEDPAQKTSSTSIKRQRSVDTLVGGMGKPTGGQLFGDPSKFGG